MKAKSILTILMTLVFSATLYGQVTLIGDSWTGYDYSGTKVVGGMAKYFETVYGKQGAGLPAIYRRELSKAITSDNDTIVLIGGLNSWGMKDEYLRDWYIKFGQTAKDSGKVLYICEYPSNLKISGGAKTIKKINRAINDGAYLSGSYKVIKCKPDKYPRKFISGFHLTNNGYKLFSDNVKLRIAEDRYNAETELNAQFSGYISQINSKNVKWLKYPLQASGNYQSLISASISSSTI